MTNQEPPSPTAELARRLEAESARRELSTYQAAEIFGVNQSTYYRWEAAQSTPAKKHVPKLAEFLNLPAEHVYNLRMGRGDWPSETPERTDLRHLIERVVDRLDALTGRVADHTDLLARMVAKLGPPGPASRQ